MTKITAILFLGVLMISCKPNKSMAQSESQFLIDSIYSKHLSEYRKHNVYLPAGFDVEKQYPIMYATDGNSSITAHKNLLDSLISNKIIKPLIFVASFSNHKIADSTSTTAGNGDKVYLSYRNFEYVDRKPTRIEDSSLVTVFQNHKYYFKDELIVQIEEKYNQDLERDDRYFYGVSNGAGFGVSLLNSNPETIGTYICLSTFGDYISSYEWDSSLKYPDLYLRYSDEETLFLGPDADLLKSKYDELEDFIEVKEFEGNHSNEYWKIQFEELIAKVLK